MVLCISVLLPLYLNKITKAKIRQDKAFSDISYSHIMHRALSVGRNLFLLGNRVLFLCGITKIA